MEVLLQSCRARFIVGLLASVVLSLSTSSARAAQTPDPMSFPASTHGSVVATSSFVSKGDCSGTVVATGGDATVVETSAACAATPGGLLFVPAATGTATPYGVWKVDSVAADAEVAFLTLEDRNGTSLKAMTGALGLSFGSPAMGASYDPDAPQTSLELDPRARQLFQSVGGEPDSAKAVRGSGLHPRLWLHSRRHGRWTTVNFGIEPDYPIDVTYTCTYDGHTTRCGTGMMIRPGTTLKLEASYGVPGHLHLIGRRTVTAAS